MCNKPKSQCYSIAMVCSLRFRASLAQMCAKLEGGRSASVLVSPVPVLRISRLDMRETVERFWHYWEKAQNALSYYYIRIGMREMS